MFTAFTAILLAIPSRAADLLWLSQSRREVYLKWHWLHLSVEWNHSGVSFFEGTLSEATLFEGTLFEATLF